MKASMIDFHYENLERFADLTRVIAALHEAKMTEDCHDEEYWLSFFDESARNYFWNPTEQDIIEWRRCWKASSVTAQLSGVDTTIRWTFSNIIDSILTGRFDVVGCYRINEDSARIELSHYTNSTGGICSFAALIRAFGFEVICDRVVSAN